MSCEKVYICCCIEGNMDSGLLTSWNGGSETIGNLNSDNVFSFLQQSLPYQLSKMHTYYRYEESFKMRYSSCDRMGG